LLGFLGYNSDYRIVLEDLVSGQGIARFARAYLKNIGRDGLFDEFIETGKNKIRGETVSLAFNYGNDEQKEVAGAVYRKISKYLGMGIAALIFKKGEKRDIEWTKKDWDYWSNIREIILGGFIQEAGREADLLISGANDYLLSIGLDNVRIRKASLPSKTAGLLGGIVYLISQGVISPYSLTAQKSGIISVDFGRSQLGSAISLISINKDDDARPVISTVYTEIQPVDIALDQQPYSEDIKDRDALVAQFIRNIAQAIDYAKEEGIMLSKSIIFSSPGMLDEEGYFIAGTEYLPQWQRKDGFHLGTEIAKGLDRLGYYDFKVWVLNDGNAAALGNIYYGDMEFSSNLIAYIGLGSGVGAGLIEKK